MNLCLRCNRPIPETLAFCESCQSSLLSHAQQKEQNPLLSSPSLQGARVRIAEKIAPPSQPEPEFVHIVRPQAGLSMPKEHEPESDDKRTVLLVQEQETVLENGHTNSTPTRPKMLPFVQQLLPQRMVPTRMRRALMLLAILVLLAVIVDGILLLLTVTSLHRNGVGFDSSPLLLLSRNFANRGDNVTVHLSHCLPGSQVLFTRDVHEPIQLDTTSPLVRIDANGNATVQIPINASWRPGSHQIEAEDIKTHYTTSAPLYIIGPEPVQAPQLKVSPTLLDMGADVQWKNTDRTVVLSNAGSGSISWVATSNQPWLMIAPTQGDFSEEQGVSIAVTRAHLKAGNYQGTITIVSNTGTSDSLQVQVQMIVLPLPSSPGAVLGVTPATLSFTATDGGTDPAGQLLQISNPGSRSLSWSLANSAPNSPVDLNMPSLFNVNWLRVQPTSGVMAPGATVSLRILVQSAVLLQGEYTRVFTFTAHQNTFASPQPVVISVNVKPPCGVETSTKSMSFPVIAGQHVPVTQHLGLSAAIGCSGTIPWKAFPSSDWLKVTPGNGLVHGNTVSSTVVTVNGGDLQMGSYNGFLVFMTTQRTDMILVQVTVQSASAPRLPPAAAPGSSTLATSTNLQLFPSALTFTAVQGQTNLPGQSVTIAPIPTGAFYWHASVVTQGANWLNPAPARGMVSTGQTGQMTINVNANGLGAGSYVAYISVTPTDASGIQVGNTQTLSVMLRVSTPCSLQVVPTALSFSSSLLLSPSAQSITLKSTGGCTYPLTWQASVDDTSRDWLSVAPTNVSDNGTGGSITVNVDTSGMLLGSYRGTITLSATDSAGSIVQNSPQTIPVRLNVLA